MQKSLRCQRGYFKYLCFSSGVAYLCGHLHTLGGLMPVLHSRHPCGTLELELGDWMDNRRSGGCVVNAVNGRSAAASGWGCPI